MLTRLNRHVQPARKHRCFHIRAKCCKFNELKSPKGLKIFNRIASNYCHGEYFMQERRTGDRYNVSFPIRVEWKDENGQRVIEEGLTENIGPQGALIYLPRLLPSVGSKVNLTVTENAEDEVTVKAQVLRLARDPSHPQVALQLTDSLRLWKKKVWDLAAQTVAAQRPDSFDDW